MISRIGFAPFLPGLDITAAQAHWAGEHARVTMTMPGIRRYWQNHAIWADGAPLLPWTGFDACSEFDFDDIAAMDRCFTSDAYRANVAPDEAGLVDKTRGGSLLARRRREGAGATAPFRLLRFWRLAPLRTPDELDAGLATFALPPGSPGAEVYTALTGAAAAQRAPAYDAVHITGFATAEAALAFARSGEARAQRHALGGIVRGGDQLVARLHIVSGE